MIASKPIETDEQQLACDVLVVGAGIVGLWIARLAARAGHSVILLDSRSSGGGASGGLLGALMPHMPERWNPKKQYQFEALAGLADAVHALEVETGMDCGYRRCGRLIPLAKPHHRDLARQRQAEVPNLWQSADTGFEWHVLDTPETADWPAKSAMPHGLVHETLAARVGPRLYLAALKAAVEPHATLLEGEGMVGWDRTSRRLATTRGRTICADTTILSAGHETFALLGDLLSRPAAEFGTAVKGQAALLQAGLSDDRPLLFHDGVYLVPHEAGFVAVGSTSETDFVDGQATDARLDVLIERATVLCPSIAGAPVIERWAGLRPKAIRRDPMIGPVPGRDGLLVATGGFKITIGIAHKMAASALDCAQHGSSPSLPRSFSLENHLR